MFVKFHLLHIQLVGWLQDMLLGNSSSQLRRKLQTVSLLNWRGNQVEE